MIARDEAVMQLYELVKSDDHGRELLLQVLSSSNPYVFYDNFEKFLSHIVQKDMMKCGAGAKKILLKDLLTALGGALYLSMKVLMVTESIKERNPKAMDSFAGSTNENELERISKDNGLFTFYSSTNNQNFEMYAEFQASFSKQFDFRQDMLELLGLDPLKIIEQTKMKPVKVQIKKTKVKKAKKPIKAKSAKKIQKKKQMKKKSIPKKKSKKKKK